MAARTANVDRSKAPAAPLPLLPRQAPHRYETPAFAEAPFPDLEDHREQAFADPAERDGCGRDGARSRACLPPEPLAMAQ